MSDTLSLSGERRAYGREEHHPRAGVDLIEGHIGEQVYVGFLFASPDGSIDNLFGVEEVIGILANPFGDARPPRLESDVGAYEVGPGSGRSFYFSPMAGTVCLRDNGIDFRPGDNALIRVAWRGSSEVGDWRPTREAWAKVNEMGITMPEHEKPGAILPSASAESQGARGGLAQGSGSGRLRP